MAEEISAHQRRKAARIALINQLPDAKGTIIVMTMADGRFLKEGITEIRGEKIARKYRMISCHQPSQLIKIEGLNEPTFVDPTVWMFCRHMEVLRGINECLMGVAVAQQLRASRAA